MLCYLYYSVTINESIEKFRIVSCCLKNKNKKPAIKNLVVPSSSSNFPVQLIC